MNQDKLSIELPPIKRFPYTFYDSRITEDMMVERVNFGYEYSGSFDRLEAVYVDTKDGYMVVNTNFTPKKPLQLTLRLRHSNMGKDYQYIVDVRNVSCSYHPVNASEMIYM